MANYHNFINPCGNIAQSTSVHNETSYNTDVSAVTICEYDSAVESRESGIKAA